MSSLSLINKARHLQVFLSHNVYECNFKKKPYPHTFRVEKSIVHFTVVCLVAKPLNRIEAKGDLVMIQTLLLLKCKLICYHANQILVSNTTRSPSASLQIKGLATKYTTVKWPITSTGEGVNHCDDGVEGTFFLMSSHCFIEQVLSDLCQCTC